MTPVEHDYEPTSLQEMGWSDFFEKNLTPQERDSFTLARVIEEHKREYIVQTLEGPRPAKAPGRFYHKLADTQLPCVGDWVLLENSSSTDSIATIARTLPRKTQLTRRTSIDRKTLKTQEQVIASNIDFVLIMSSLNQDFNPRRLDRYLAVVGSSGAKPIILLSKSDLCPNPQKALAEAQAACPGVDIHIFTNFKKTSLRAIDGLIPFGATSCMIGSSGVGKSTLINHLCGYERQWTLDIRESDGRGRHATVARSLIFLPRGRILIDTPGIREIAPWSENFTEAYLDIEELALKCRFTNCQHRTEPGCAILLAIKEGRLDPKRFEHYQALNAQLQCNRQSHLPAYRAQAAQDKRKKLLKKKNIQLL